MMPAAAWCAARGRNRRRNSGPGAGTGPCRLIRNRETNQMTQDSICGPHPEVMDGGEFGDGTKQVQAAA